MKDFVGTTEAIADRLGEALRSVECDALVALTHYAPVPDTLVGEPLEIYPFLGCYQLGQAIDSAPTALALHGHAHHGSERGRTPGRGAGAQRRPPGDQAGVQRLPAARPTRWIVRTASA